MSTNDRLLKFLQAPPDVQAEIGRILDGDIPERPATTASGPLLLGMGEGARFLGVSRATLWRMIRNGRLGRVEVLPGSFRVRRADLEALANGRKQEAK
ncbi:MAG TPA: helix-turn-helix domain-containing protein [Verrucomicrobiae bacterium]|nr:helix-turn-helix domain-containing protein [Verrucomicrobiae bacterium]